MSFTVTIANMVYCWVQILKYNMRNVVAILTSESKVGNMGVPMKELWNSWTPEETIILSGLYTFHLAHYWRLSCYFFFFFLGYLIKWITFCKKGRNALGIEIKIFAQRLIISEWNQKDAEERVEKDLLGYSWKWLEGGLNVVSQVLICRSKESVSSYSNLLMWWSEGQHLSLLLISFSVDSPAISVFEKEMCTIVCVTIREISSKYVAL